MWDFFYKKNIENIDTRCHSINSCLLASGACCRRLLLLLVFSPHQKSTLILFSVCWNSLMVLPLNKTLAYLTHPLARVPPPHAELYRVECSMTLCRMSSNLRFLKWYITFFFLPLKKLSTTITMSPLAINWSTRFDHMNPTPLITMT